jgi:hypothetical protein
MSDYRHPPGSNSCSHHDPHHRPRCDDDDDDDGCGPISNPADQPRSPGNECQKHHWPPHPDLPKPTICLPECCCPFPTYPPVPNCLELMIGDQDYKATEAAELGNLTALLKEVLDKATGSEKDYTLKRYAELVKLWKCIDCDIAEVVRRLVCTIPCWYCLIECHICPLLYAIRYREDLLRGEGADRWRTYEHVHSLYDLQYWYKQDVRRKQAAVDRIAAVLRAWETPATTIADAIAANRAIIDKAPNPNTADYVKFLYDVFFQVLPLHLAIAPPVDCGVTTVIPKKYTQFCECDLGERDDCCGPNVGPLTVRERLVKAQPYLVRPDQILKILCCIAEHRYLPASHALASAKAHEQQIDTQVTAYEQDIDRRLSALPDAARSALPYPVDCEKYSRKPEHEHGGGGEHHGGENRNAR